MGTNELAPGMISYDSLRLIDLVLRLVINTIFVFTVAKVFYFPKSRKKEYFFTYILLGFAIFMLIHLMDFAKMKTGIGMGLFAIFCIMRYRTESVAIREMTYIFVIIALSAVNAMGWELNTPAGQSESLSDELFSILELFFTNVLFIVMIWFAENANWVKGMSTKYVRYDKIDLISPEKREELIADLNKRTGLTIVKVDIGAIDFLKDMALIKIYYTENEGNDSALFKMPKIYE